MRVSAPATTANLGSGFDVIGLAIDRRLVLDDQAAPLDDGHPAAVAHRAAGGRGRLGCVASLPAGRGLGFSAAARVAGAFLARIQANESEATARDQAFDVACELEGHGDNAAASAYGGLCLAVEGRPVPLEIATPLELVIWTPEASETSTDRSRRRLPDTVTRADAVFNLGRLSLLVAGLTLGRLDLLAEGTQDRLHQPARLDDSPSSRAALDAFREAGALGVWLSGSGPSIAAIASPGSTSALLAAAPPAGRAHLCRVEPSGVRLDR